MPLGPSDLIISDGCALPLRLPSLPPPLSSLLVFSDLRSSPTIQPHPFLIPPLTLP